MAAYRPLGQFPQFFLSNGDVNSGGFVWTYETDLTTLKLTYSDPGLSVANPNPIPLDSSGFPSVDVWGDGEYGMQVADEDGVTYRTANNIRPDSGSTQVIPALAPGFLTNDLTNLIWQAILQVPDPSGFSGQILSNDGANPIWIPQQDIPDPPITNSSTSLKVGTALIQWGTGSSAATGTRQTSTSPVFGTAFDATAYVVLVQPTNIATTGLQIAVPSVLTKTATGFTVQFDSDDFSQANASFASAVTFDYVAIGLKN